MPLNNEVQEVIKFFSGQKSALPHEILQSSDATQILNFICRKGRLRKMWGAALYADASQPDGSGGVLWIDYFLKRWIIQHGNAIGFEDSEGSKTFTNLGQIFNGVDSRIRSEKWLNTIFMVNGTENKTFENTFYTGEKYIDLGIFPPGHGLRAVEGLQPAFTADVSSGGTLSGTTTYKYLITYLDDLRGVESLPNGAEVGENGLWSGRNVVTKATIGGSVKMDINASALIDAGYPNRVTHWVLYRAEQADGVTFKRCNLDPIPITTKTCADTDGTESHLGAVLDESFSPPPSGRFYTTGQLTDNNPLIGPKFVRFFRDQLWLFGVDYRGLALQEINPVSGLAYASIGMPNVGAFDYWTSDQIYDIGRATGQKDTGMEKFNNTLLFFKEASTYALVGTNPDNYQVRELDPQRGFTVPHSVQVTPIGVIGICADGFVVYDGTGPGRLISEEIFDEFEKINLDHIEKIHSAYDPKEGKYECHVPYRTSITVNRVFMFDVNSRVWQFLNVDMGQATGYGVDSKKKKVALLGDQLNGRLYDIADTTQITFNDQTIHARWMSKHFDFGHPDKIKGLQFVTIKARATSAIQITLDAIADFGQGGTVTVKDVDPDPTESKWDQAHWDQGLWAGPTIPIKFEIPIQITGQNIQISIRESQASAANSQFEIEEIILQASLMGR